LSGIDSIQANLSRNLSTSFNVISESVAQQMFAQDFLIQVAEDIVNKAEEASHMEETGFPLIHFDFEITKAEQPVLYSGRLGNYYKFNFEYCITLLDDEGLKSMNDDVRTYRRSVRLTSDGRISAFGERVEI
jgi:hypothetical protein